MALKDGRIRAPDHGRRLRQPAADRLCQHLAAGRRQRRVAGAVEFQGPGAGPPPRERRAVLPGGAIPDVRTRDGFRLRWWRGAPVERSSAPGGSATHPQALPVGHHRQLEPPRRLFLPHAVGQRQRPASLLLRCYTRDLFDQEVSWDALAPRAEAAGCSAFPSARRSRVRMRWCCSRCRGRKPASRRSATCAISSSRSSAGTPATRSATRSRIPGSEGQAPARSLATHGTRQQRMEPDTPSAGTTATPGLLGHADPPDPLRRGRATNIVVYDLSYEAESTSGTTTSCPPDRGRAEEGIPRGPPRRPAPERTDRAVLAPQRAPEPTSTTSTALPSG